jgi:hypothetical protein
MSDSKFLTMSGNILDLEFFSTRLNPSDPEFGVECLHGPDEARR